MYQVVIVIHILLGLGIIGLIMMQQGKGADAGAGFGAGASGSVFGAQGSASFLSRMTAIFATLFFITSLGLAWLNSHKNAPSIDIMGSSDKEISTDIVLPDDKNAILPGSQPENKPAPIAPPPPQPATVDQAPPIPSTPPVTTVAPKIEDMPMVEEKESELNSEPEPKAPKAKKK